MLGPSLEDIFEKCHHKFSIKTVAMLAIQMVMRVQSVHEQGLIYRDIKPDNFLLGRPNSSKEGSVFMIDFGMAKYYINPKTNQHIPYKERKSLTGTARYMSINTHLGREQSRRDDLESLGHVLMYFLRGSLPWQGLKAANAKQKYTKIGEKKQITSIKELCGGFPEEFAQYMNYVRTLGFDDNPDYKLLLGLFEKVLVKVGQPNDGIYDWVSRDNVISKESRSSTANTRCIEVDAHRPLQQQEVIRVSQPHGAPNIEVKKSFWSRILNILACRACD
ncbi:Palmitoylated plasma membrane-bound casein kinase, variant 2 [Basidiobolus ranarum]